MTGQSDYPTLFSSLNIAGLELQNRIVMPPMANAMEPGSDQYRCWYEARAAGGVALIITGAHNVAELQTEKFANRLKGTVDAVHDHGVPIVQQIIQRPPTEEATGEAMDPSDLSTEQMARIPGGFAAAVARCKEIGFDGVEPHGAHGFFLNQVFSTESNRRTDEYGGSLEGRMKLGLDIIGAIRDEVGDDYPLLYRHTPQQEGGYTADDSVVFVQKLIEAGVDVPDISPSTADAVLTDDDQAAGDTETHNLAAFIKRNVSAPIIAVGGMEDPAVAEAALDNDKCDLCAVGRQLIADAHWPNKIKEGLYGDIIECIKCDEKCFGNLSKGIPIGCTQNPRSGNEYKYESD